MAAALFSFIDSISENIAQEVEKTVQGVDAGVELDEILDDIATAGSHEPALKEGYLRLEALADAQPVQVRREWVIDGKLLPAVCNGLCATESSRSAAGALARVLNGLRWALEQTEATEEELAGFSDQVVRHTENGKALLKVLQVDEVRSQTQGLILLQHLYPEAKGLLGKNLLGNPELVGTLMEMLQEVERSPWEGEEGQPVMHLCSECIKFLLLVTQDPGEMHMIICFQGGVEALLAIVSKAMKLCGGRDTGQLLESAVGASRCILSLVKAAGAVAQKLIRENGGLRQVVLTLQEVMQVQLQAPFSDSMSVLVHTLLEVLAAFVAAGSEKAGNAKSLLQSSGFMEFICMECLSANNKQPAMRQQALNVLCTTTLAVEDSVLDQLLSRAPGTGSLSTLIGLLVAADAPLGERIAADDLLANGVLRSHKLRELIAYAFMFVVAPAKPDVQEDGAAPPQQQAPVVAPTECLVAAARSVLAVLKQAGVSGSTPTPAQQQGIRWMEDPVVWFAAHFIGHCLRGESGLKAQLATVDPETHDSVLLAVLTRVAGLAGESLQSGWQGGTSLCAILRLVAEWCGDCMQASSAVANSAALMPELLRVLEANSEGIPPDGRHVRGLTALVLGCCVLQLPKTSEGGQAVVAASTLVQLIKTRIGFDSFTRVGQEFLQVLSSADATTTTTTTTASSDIGVAERKRYDASFVKFVSVTFQSVQQVMVQIWLDQSSAAPALSGQDGSSGQPAVGQSEGGSGGGALAADVAEHYKDIIKMQDKEIQSQRQQIEKLVSENDSLRKLTTDEDKTLLVWKVEALTKQCQTLREQCDQLAIARSKAATKRLQERAVQRAKRADLEMQLNVLAVLLDEMEMRALTAEGKENPRRFECILDGTDGMSPHEASVRRQTYLRRVAKYMTRLDDNADGALTPDEVLEEQEQEQEQLSAELPAEATADVSQVGAPVSGDADTMMVQAEGADVTGTAAPDPSLQQVAFQAETSPQLEAPALVNGHHGGQVAQKEDHQQLQQPHADPSQVELRQEPAEYLRMQVTSQAEELKLAQQAEEQRRLEDQQRQEEQRMQEKQRAQAAEQLRLQQQWQAEEEQRIQEQHRAQAAEQLRLEQQQTEEEQRMREQQRAQAAEQLRLEQLRQAEEEQRIQEQQRAQAAEQLRLEQLRQAEEEQRRQEQQRADAEQLRLQKQRQAEEEQRIQAQQELEQRQRLEQQQKEAEQLRLEQLRQQEEEQQRLKERQQAEQLQLEQEQQQQQQQAEPSAGSAGTTQQAQASPSPGTAEAAPLPAGWAAYQSPEGYTFYFNATTQVSQWDRPA